MSVDMLVRNRPEAPAWNANVRVRSPPAPEARKKSSPKNDSVQLPRSASYTYFGNVKDAVFDETQLIEPKNSSSEEEREKNGGRGSTSSGSTSPETEPSAASEATTVQSQHLHEGSKIVITRTEAPPATEGLTFETYAKSSAAEPRKAELSPRETTRRARSGSTTSKKSEKNRRSWFLPSRSPSPVKKRSSESNGPETPTKDQADSKSSRRKSLIYRRRSSKPTIEQVPQPAPEPPTPRRKSLLVKKSRPSSIFGGKTDDEKGSFAASEIPEVPKVPELPPIPRSPGLPISFSTDRLPSLSRSQQSSEQIPPVLRNLSPDNHARFRSNPTRKKDELWSVFRALDGDFQKFQTKSISLKTNVVRSSLLPFLRSYANHASNNRLRAEDLDRRANILNKWWSGLLEMLHGRNNQSISGTDRPAILDAIAGIMERPEWRLGGSLSNPSSARTSRNFISPAASTTSLSSSSDFLIESVQHNVRNIFISNLSAQMAFVVDKMSLRNASASLVTFCGKACAYAFMFCPGVADILVRLWEPCIDTMNRVLAEAGISKFTNTGVTCDTVLPSFPSHLHGLEFRTLAKYARTLRTPPKCPIVLTTIPWNSAWISRWSGKESDLFYVFVKYFHILVQDFIPADASKIERICVPGLLPVHAQILANLDSTMHRHAAGAVDDSHHGASSITFDDVLGDPDAVAEAVPIPPTNAARLMAENRLIMLLRDVLSERSSPYLAARRMFAEAFSDMLIASAKKVSIYDQGACYTLCDFLEEALSILTRYENANPEEPSVLNWPFWLSVCKHMVESQNTTTEIRLYAFLYSVWTSISSDATRKADLCMGFLLDPEFFQRRFNHWCPMVRAYYMRLLCWRVARHDDHDGPGDGEILDALGRRLLAVHNQHIYLQQEATKNSSTPPSSAPCNPAPSRRLLIMRTDTTVVSNGSSFMSFDGIVSPTAESEPHKRLSRAGTMPDMRPSTSQSFASDSSDGGQGEEGGKRKWGLLRTIIDTTRSRSKSPRANSKEQASKQGGVTSTDAVESKNSGSMQSPAVNGNSAARQAETAAVPHRAYCFKFSLEWVDRRLQPAGNMRLLPPRLPLPAQRYMESLRASRPVIQPTEPVGAAARTSRYAGRALAEWALVVSECQNFFERRKKEGVPSNKQVETPTLGFEAFRRPG